MSRPFQLATDVFACKSGDQLVFLDLRKDKYVCLDEASSSRLAPVVQDANEDTARHFLENAPTEIDALIAADLIAPSINGYANKTPPPAAVSDSLLPRPGTAVDLAVGDVFRFFTATTIAGIRLRHQHIHAVVLRERRRKWQPKMDLRETSRRIAIYSRLRVFSGLRRQCLHDSLGLRLFLASYSISSTWVFGVRLRPFAAHCWLQVGGYVLNDTVDYVRNFTPIMAVGDPPA